MIKQKLVDSVIHCVDSLNFIFLFSKFNNCFAKCSADASIVVHTYWSSKTIFTKSHKTDDLRYTLNSSAAIERGLTGRVCRKSLDNKISAPPKKNDKHSSLLV